MTGTTNHEPTGKTEIRESELSESKTSDGWTWLHPYHQQSYSIFYFRDRAFFSIKDQPGKVRSQTNVPQSGALNQ